jgi:broad specificity phosphatase PhoE
MTRLILIRHATDCSQDRLAGRNVDVHLSADGKVQGERLAHGLRQQRIGRIYSSPQPRARETARFLAELFGETVRIAPENDEIDFGAWTGRTFEELREIAQWREFNLARSCTRIPNGDLMVEVQAGVIERLCGCHPTITLALVSHADVIRVALAHCLGMPLDLLLRLEVSPASISIVVMERYGPRVLCINNMGELGDQKSC